MKSMGSPASLSVPEETLLLVGACTVASKGIAFVTSTTHSLPKAPLVTPENVNEL